jgi:hypothetical protein
MSANAMIEMFDSGKYNATLAAEYLMQLNNLASAAEEFTLLTVADEILSAQINLAQISGDDVLTAYEFCDHFEQLFDARIISRDDPIYQRLLMAAIFSHEDSIKMADKIMEFGDLPIAVDNGVALLWKYLEKRNAFRYFLYNDDQKFISDILDRESARDNATIVTAIAIDDDRADNSKPMPSPDPGAVNISAQTYKSAIYKRLSCDHIFEIHYICSKILRRMNRRGLNFWNDIDFRKTDIIIFGSSEATVYEIAAYCVECMNFRAMNWESLILGRSFAQTSFIIGHICAALYASTNSAVWFNSRQLLLYLLSLTTYADIGDVAFYLFESLKRSASRLAQSHAEDITCLYDRVIATKEARSAAAEYKIDTKMVDAIITNSADGRTFYDPTAAAAFLHQLQIKYATDNSHSYGELHNMCGFSNSISLGEVCGKLMQLMKIYSAALYDPIIHKAYLMILIYIEPQICKTHLRFAANMPCIMSFGAEIITGYAKQRNLMSYIRANCNKPQKSIAAMMKGELTASSKLPSYAESILLLRIVNILPITNGILFKQKTHAICGREIFANSGNFVFDKINQVIYICKLDLDDVSAAIVLLLPFVKFDIYYILCRAQLGAEDLSKLIAHISEKICADDKDLLYDIFNGIYSYCMFRKFGSNDTTDAPINQLIKLALGAIDYLAGDENLVRRDVIRGKISKLFELIDINGDRMSVYHSIMYRDYEDDPDVE